MKFFKCIPARQHPVIVGVKRGGKRYAVYDGPGYITCRRMELGHEKNGWFTGWGGGQLILSNCRDTTWIAASLSLTHIWHVDRAGTMIAFEHGGTFHLMFADGFLVDIEHKDLDDSHKWGRMEVYFDPKGFLLYFVFDDPEGQLHVFNINELHLLAAILARTDQREYYRRLWRKRERGGKVSRGAHDRGRRGTA
jgi:hypothetical protein